MSNNRAETLGIRSKYRYDRGYDVLDSIGSICPVEFGDLDKKTVLKACSLALKELSH